MGTNFRVTAGGGLLDGNPVSGGIPISTKPQNQQDPAVAASGAFLVVWRQSSGASVDIWAARVAGDGTVQDPDGFTISQGPFNNGVPDLIGGPGSKWTLTYSHFSGPYQANQAFVRTVAPK